MHRIRTDLDNVTVTPHPPITVGTAQGYLKYYEGPASDFSIARVNTDGSLLPAGQFNDVLTRFGDIDDIFMATVKAKDTWFTGKVPRFVAERRPPASFADMSDFVTISSQFAEVVIFAQPTVATSKTGFPDNPNRDPNFLTADPRSFEDIDTNLIPDSFRLHYRTLLIRPDLNLDTGVLPNLPGDNVMIARPQSIIGTGPPIEGTILSTPECDMSTIFQYCDLSIRRVDHTANASTVAANTLEDLSNPANRFAHVIHAVPSQNAITAITMPVLALWQTYASFQGADPDVAGSGMLHPAYALRGDRTGEDVLTTDLLAFDVKAYDSSAPVIRTSDAGTTLRPGDPGFGTAEFPLANGSNIVAYGEFVDLNWAGKLGLGYVSELSGVRSNGFPTEALFKSGLVKVINDPPTRQQLQFQIFQPSYDTYTNLYESDGVLQAELALNVGRGLVTITGNANLLETWRTSIDAGTDGVDNAGSAPGVDDPSERETSPPFPVDLRGLQISVRLEDPTKKQFKQMSTVKQFVTN
jgi:hypothetical protein